MPPHDKVRTIASSQDGLITTAQAVEAGLAYDEMRTLRRRRQWRTLVHGVHLVDAERFADGLPDRVWWRAALLAHGPGSCLVATTAAQALGLVGIPPGRRDIEVAAVAGRSRHPRRGVAAAVELRAVDRRIVARQLPVAADQVTIHDGLAVRIAFHSVVDAALEVDRATALALMDSALHRGLLTAAQLGAGIDQAGHRRGIVEVRRLAAIADGRAESQVESRVRLACVDGDVAPDDLQHVVRDRDGHVLAIGDLAWLAQRDRPLLAEADGESVHSLPTAVYRDRSRGNALVAQACDTVRFTYADTFKRGYIAYVVKAALRAA